jgi:hypothetical protein
MTVIVYGFEPKILDELAGSAVAAIRPGGGYSPELPRDMPAAQLSVYMEADFSRQGLRASRAKDPQMRWCGRQSPRFGS